MHERRSIQKQEDGKREKFMAERLFDHAVDRSSDHSLKYHAGPMLSDPKMIPLWIADMDFAAPKAVRDALEKRCALGVFGYTAPWDKYLQAVQNWMKSRHHTAIEKDWIVTAPGIVPAIKILIQALTKEEDPILIFPPVYHPFKNSIEELNRTLVCSPLKEENGIYSIDFENLETQLKEKKVRMVIFCSPHNPTGNVWAKKDLQRLAALCKKYDIVLVSDEIHMDFDPDHRHTTMLEADPTIADQLVLCTAPSKTFNLAGLQDSNLIIPDETIRKAVRKTMSRCGMGEANVLGLVACQTAYEHGAEWVDELNACIRENARFIQKYLEEHIPEIRMAIPQGTYLFWLDCRGLQMSDEELHDFFLNKAHLWLNDGVMFGQEGSGFMRLNAACPRSTLKRALDQLADAWNEKKKNQIPIGDLSLR